MDGLSYRVEVGPVRYGQHQLDLGSPLNFRESAQKTQFTEGAHKLRLGDES